MTHLQNDLATLSSALNDLRSEVKQTDSSATQTQKSTQASLAAAIAFIQLREAATSGRKFVNELAAMRKAARNDGDFQQQLGKLESFAPMGAPTFFALQEELISLEGPIARTTAQTLWQKILTELKSLISVRPLHGGDSVAFTAMERALAQGDGSVALDDMKNLPTDAQTVLNDWRTHVEARQQIDTALQTMADHFTVLTNISPASSQDVP
jgi:hypothetical protein